MDTLYAYLAGTIDSDGCITLQRSHRQGKSHGNRHPVYYVTKVVLQQVEAEIPDLLYQTFGGYRYEWRPQRPNSRMTYSWMASNQQVIPICHALMPYLRLKRQQAALLLQFMERRQLYRRGLPLPPEEHAVRDALYAEITRLNQPRNRRVHLP